MKFLKELLKETFDHSTCHFTWNDIEESLCGVSTNAEVDFPEMWDQIGYAIEEKHPGTFSQDTLRYKGTGDDLTQQAFEYIESVYFQKGPEKGIERVKKVLSNMDLLESKQISKTNHRLIVD